MKTNIQRPSYRVMVFAEIFPFHLFYEKNKLYINKEVSLA